MKICPECHSSYSDETLNFCLTDGVPLVVEEVLSERLSAGRTHSSWQEAETLHDSNFSLPFSPPVSAAGEHTTSPNSDAAPTFASSGSHTASLNNLAAPPDNSAGGATAAVAGTKKSSRFALIAFVVGGALALGAAAGGFWYYAGRGGEMNAAANSQSSAQTPAGRTEGRKTAAAAAAAAVPLTAAEENQIKKEVSAMIEAWRSSIEKREVETHVKNYVESLDNYYKESGIHREHVRADRQRAFDRYPIINLQIDNLKIEPASAEAATVVFDKTWTFKNPQRISTGSVQQEMELIKQNGRWLINGERDAKVYYINNRDNPDADSATNAGQTAANQNAQSNQ